MAANYDFVIEQYATFTRSFTFKDKTTAAPVDITGGIGLMQLRDENNIVVLELSTTNGGIILGNGTIDLLIPAADTALLTFTKATHDLIITYGTPLVTERLFQGKSKLSLGVSHA